MIAYFISPHGFGHAARAAGVMEAVQQLDPAIQFEIYTTIPKWFFEDSHLNPFRYHPIRTDIGMIQETPFQEDLKETIRCLNEFFPLNHSDIVRLSQKVRGQKCKLVVSDISPIGIPIAKEAGVPSVLVENFTWDWIYAGYLDGDPRMERHIDYLRQVYAAADFHVQTEPVCRPMPVNLVTRPVSRRFRTPKSRIRERLGISCNSKVILITMGGIPEKLDFLDKLKTLGDTVSIVPGMSKVTERQGNVVCLSFRSGFYHPDLINASDAVVGKAGYSTLSEVYHAGIPFGYITRPQFCETEILSKFIKEEMEGVEIKESEYRNGFWINYVEELLSLPRIQRNVPNGSEQIARFVLDVLKEI